MIPAGMRYSTELANRLRLCLFKPQTFRDAKARYDAKSDDLEGEALGTWAVHGVCLICRCQAITCGRCVECGRVYSTHNLGSFDSETMVLQQLRRAHEVLK